MKFERTLPRALVHRAAVAEVFLTDAERRGEDEILLAAQLPRLHAFYDDTLGPRTGRDPMMLLEACRQGIFVVAHRFLDVPLDHKFLLRTVEFEVSDPGPPTPDPFPADVVITARIEHRARGRSGVTGLRLRFTATVGNREVMTAGIDYSWMPPQQWTRLRAVQRGRLELPAVPIAPPVARIRPELVGRRDPANAVISPVRALPDDSLTARLVPDTSHPVMFDHWVDHVPGMLELEAFRQLAVAAAVRAGVLLTPAAQPVALHARFRSFAELDLPVECRTGPVRPGADVECVLRQPGALVADARVRLAERGPAVPARPHDPMNARAQSAPPALAASGAGARAAVHGAGTRL
ncbi:ScbA/BarX family gamma-butyrolactone biosynthesis protein [Streptomyces sp. NPDC059466]|uniref:ScbA/BarX family gamma-butyrolactone biosynthesis protein n=1 Tax=unclassified Streptomyces TaxID=2593676 RepID=UPI003698BC8C